MRNLMYTKHNGDNAKLRIFSFIPQRTTTYTTQFCKSYIRNSQTYKHNPNNQNNNINVGFTPLTEILCSYNWDNAKSGVFIFKLRNKLTNFVHFIHHQFVHFIDSKKPVRDLINNLTHFTQPNMNPLLLLQVHPAILAIRVVLSLPFPFSEILSFTFVIKDKYDRNVFKCLFIKL